MENLIEDITYMLTITKTIDIYLHYYGKCPQEDLDFAFYDYFNIVFTKEEYELKEKRTHQIQFRNQLIDKYKSCIVTGMPEIMCEACHIIPFCKSNEKQKYNIDNGLLLEAGIHKLFDDFLFSIEPEQKMIIFSNKILNDSNYEFLHKYNGKHLDNLNEQTLIFLKEHYKEFIKRN